VNSEAPVTEEELASLLASLSAAQREGPRRAPGHQGKPLVHEARVHDFARSETLSASSVQALQSAYTAFARGSAAALSSYLHVPLETSFLSLDQLTYDQFVRSVPDPTVAAVFRADPLAGSGILELNPAVAFWIVDRLLGGSGAIADGPRPLTEIEKALVEGAISRMLSELAASWRDLVHLEPALVEILDSAEAADIARPTDAAAVASFEVKVGDITSTASICLPVISLKLARVGARGPEDAQHRDQPPDPASTRAGLVRALEHVPITCTVRLGTALVPAAELAALERGDVICLDNHARGDLLMLVGDVPKFRCHPTSSGRQLAVRLRGAVS